MTANPLHVIREPDARAAAVDCALEHLEDLGATELALAIALDLHTISAEWHVTADPMRLGDGTGTGRALPGSTLELRADIALTLAYWVHALVDEWPAVIQHLEHSRVPHPTTSPASYPGWQHDGPLVVITDSVDLGDVVAMADLLAREAARLAEWEEPTPGGHPRRYGLRLAAELQPLAREVRQIVKPPKRDTVTVGDCPACEHPVKIRPTVRVPQPTSDPDRLAEWTTVPAAEPWAWANVGIKHPCGAEWTLEGWHRAILGNVKPMTAEALVDELHRRLGVRYSPVTVRVWSRRGLVATQGYTAAGHALYDLREVLAVLVQRDTIRDEMARSS